MNHAVTQDVNNKLRCGANWQPKPIAPPKFSLKLDTN